MQKKFLLFGILFGLVLVGYGIFYAMSFFSTRASLQAYNDYNNIFLNDTYGGKTPEETLKLFIDALKAGDIDQATLYFMPDDHGSREQWKQFLSTVDRSQLETSLSSVQPTISLYKGQQWFEAYVNRRKVSVDLVFNGHVWKIDSL